MTAEEVRSVFVNELSIGRHGSFLVRFAQAIIQADPDNLELLRPAAEALIAKYNLTNDPDRDPDL